MFPRVPFVTDLPRSGVPASSTRRAALGGGGPGTAARGLLRGAGGRRRAAARPLAPPFPAPLRRPPRGGAAGAGAGRRGRGRARMERGGGGGRSEGSATQRGRETRRVAPPLPRARPRLECLSGGKRRRGASRPRPSPCRQAFVTAATLERGILGADRGEEEQSRYLQNRVYP